MRKILTAALFFAVLFVLAAPGLGAERVKMIGGLSALPRLTPEEAAALPEPDGPVTLLLDGVQLPYDAASNTYFIPQSSKTTSFDGSIEPEPKAGWTYYLLSGSESDKQAMLANSASHVVYGVSGDACAASKVIFTSLPVLCIETGSGNLPAEEDSPGRLTYFEAEAGGLSAVQTPIEINLRGNTSKRLPKQSYRVKMLTDEGANRNLSIAGLRSDDDWILNPLYADTSKIREKLAYELWAEMNSAGTAAASSRLEYVEVFLNGSYWGLYGVQERIDRKQVDASKRAGVLYKVIANDRPTVAELLAADSEICRGLELEFAGASVENPWEPAAAYMAALNGETAAANARLSLENTVDYGLWAMLTQAHDCHFKNQFLNCVNNGLGYTIYKIPWDLNNTFGDVWNSGAAEANYTDFRIGKLVMDSAFELLVGYGDSAAVGAVQNRWAELREEIITEDAILGRAREIHESVYPAICRDSVRWPECGMGEGNAANLRDIESYVRAILPRMDEYIANLGENTEEI